MIAPRPPAPPSGESPGRGVLFTDLDGTLLDLETYQPSRVARELVDELARDGILTVAVTSKTATEVGEVAASVRLAPVAVVEGGGVLLLQDGTTTIVGTGREQLIGVLVSLREEGWAVRGFSDMSVHEVAERTGLTTDSARCAMDRLASEPFVVVRMDPPNVEDLRRRASELGAEVTRGGRFWHLVGAGVDKGSGVDAALALLGLGGGATTTGAVGDAWNDLAMLERVEHPYFLGDRVPPRMLPPRVHRVAEDGPAGFVSAARAFRRECRGGQPAPTRGRE